MHFTRKTSCSKNHVSPRTLVKTHKPGGLAEEGGLRTYPLKDVANLVEKGGRAPLLGGKAGSGLPQALQG